MHEKPYLLEGINSSPPRGLHPRINLLPKRLHCHKQIHKDRYPWVDSGSKSISNSGLSSGTAIHTYSITLSVAFSSYKAMACFSEFDYDIPGNRILNLTVIPINFSSTMLKLELHSLSAYQIDEAKLRYMVYDSALTEI